MRIRVFKNLIALLLLVTAVSLFFGCDNACDHSETEWITLAEATHQAEGSRREECRICGESIRTEAIPKTECSHTDTEWIIVNEATLESDGSRQQKCKICGAVVSTQVISKSECAHTDTEWITDEEPTYAKEGVKHQECKICSQIILTEKIDKLICSHGETQWVVETEPTTESTGVKRNECKTCSYVFRRSDIPRLHYSTEQLKEMLNVSMVKITCYDNIDGVTVLTQGSGFFVNDSGAFITNAHVIGENRIIKVSTYDGKVYEVDEVYFYNYTTSDYAICHIPCASVPVGFADTEKFGDVVYSVGFPKDSLSPVVNAGSIISIYKEAEGKRYLLNTAHIAPGSSGGILCDGWGRVIGITTGSFGGEQFAAIHRRDFIENVGKLQRSAA